MSTLTQIKAQNDSRLAEEKRLIERKRNVLLLIEQFCTENGYLQTAEKLQQEAGITSSKFVVIENIDLLRIVQEYENFEEMKFGKKPKLVRRAQQDDDKTKILSDKKAAARERRARRNEYVSPHMPVQSQLENNAAFASISNTRKQESHQNKSSTFQSEHGNQENGVNEVKNLALVGQKPTTQTTSKAPESFKIEENEEEDRLLKPLPLCMQDSEMRALAGVITREIFQKDPNVRWSDVIGLEETKRLLKEAIVMPLQYPQIFHGLLSPWSGILLYGPPGNGKMMLAKAVATECKTTFFNISASSVVSKYRGDSEKLIRLLFELARHHAPSTIFLDEIDSIMSQRDSGGQEHEASRRMKTELLIQMDGLAKTSDVVFVLAASNLPWELDNAMLRRLEKRVLVDLPSPEARLSLLQSLLAPYVAPNFEYAIAVDRTEGFSGADLRLLAKETCMSPVRRLMNKLDQVQSEDTHIKKSFDPTQTNWKDLLGFVEREDLIQALDRTKPSTSQTFKKYQNWQARFGCI